KDDLESSVEDLNKILAGVEGKAYVSVNKALVTQSSSAIPVVPLYISLLYKVMKEKGIHEGTIEQMQRLFSERLYGEGEIELDEKGRIRVDDWEMREDVQAEVQKLWDKATTENLEKISDIEGYRKEFFHLFGFEFDEVDYQADTNEVVDIPSIEG